MSVATLIRHARPWLKHLKILMNVGIVQGLVRVGAADGARYHAAHRRPPLPYPACLPAPARPRRLCNGSSGDGGRTKATPGGVPVRAERHATSHLSGRS
jgi:hypothetical protein